MGANGQGSSFHGKTLSLIFWSHEGVCESFHKVGGYQSLFIQCLDGTRSSYLGLTFKFHVLMEIKECSSKG